MPTPAGPTVLLEAVPAPAGPPVLLEAVPAPAGTAPRRAVGLTRLGRALVLLELDCDLPAGAAAPALLVEGEPLPPPHAALALGGRLVLAARDPAGRLAPGVLVELGPHGLPLPLGPDRPAAALAAGRSPEERLRLLRFLATTAATALRATGDPALAGLCLALSRDAGAGALVRPLGRAAGGLSAWRVPARPPGRWRLVTPQGIRTLDPPQGGVLLLGAPPPPGAVLLPPAPAAPLGFAAPGGAVPDLADLARQGLRGKAPGRALLPALLDRARGDAASAALLREAQLLAPATPRRLEDPVAPVGGALELALADHGGGLFLCGWLRDPLALVAGMELIGPGGTLPLDPATLHRVARPDLAARFAGAPLGGAGALPGFLAHLPEAGHPGIAQWRLGLRLASGERLALTAPPGLMPAAVARDLVLRAVHPEALRPGLLEACLAPAAARLHRAARAGWGTPPAPLAFGPPAPRARPRASLVVPLYRQLRFLPFQVAAFARDPETRAADLIFVLDSPEQRAEAERALAGLAALHGLPLRLLVLPENRGYAGACNAGAAEARAPVLVFLNSDVLPAAPGWLGALLRRLGRLARPGAVGPKLLFDDGSVQHAGLLFRRDARGLWFNDHYAKGFPRHHPAALRGGRVPAVTGAALCLPAEAFAAASGFCTDYVVGDFEDSDLCLKLRALGWEIAYEPQAELHHFERQSIALHAGHARTLAGEANRLLHHRRWDQAIAALMARFPGR